MKNHRNVYNTILFLCYSVHVDTLSVQQIVLDLTQPFQSNSILLSRRQS